MNDDPRTMCPSRVERMPSIQGAWQSWKNSTDHARHKAARPTPRVEAECESEAEEHEQRPKRVAAILGEQGREWKQAEAPEQAGGDGEGDQEGVEWPTSLDAFAGGTHEFGWRGGVTSVRADSSGITRATEHTF